MDFECKINILNMMAKSNVSELNKPRQSLCNSCQGLRATIYHDIQTLLVDFMMEWDKSWNKSNVEEHEIAENKNEQNSDRSSWQNNSSIPVITNQNDNSPITSPTKNQIDELSTKSPNYGPNRLIDNLYPNRSRDGALVTNSAYLISSCPPSGTGGSLNSSIESINSKWTPPKGKDNHKRKIYPVGNRSPQTSTRPITIYENTCFNDMQPNYSMPDLAESFGSKETHTTSPAVTDSQPPADALQDSLVGAAENHRNPVTYTSNTSSSYSPVSAVKSINQPPPEAGSIRQQPTAKLRHLRTDPALMTSLSDPLQDGVKEFSECEAAIDYALTCDIAKWRQSSNDQPTSINQNYPSSEDSRKFDPQSEFYSQRGGRMGENFDGRSGIRGIGSNNSGANNKIYDNNYSTSCQHCKSCQAQQHHNAALEGGESAPRQRNTDKSTFIHQSETPGMNTFSGDHNSFISPQNRPDAHVFQKPSGMTILDTDSSPIDSGEDAQFVASSSFFFHQPGTVQPGGQSFGSQPSRQIPHPAAATSGHLPVKFTVGADCNLSSTAVEHPHMGKTAHGCSTIPLHDSLVNVPLTVDTRPNWPNNIIVENSAPVNSFIPGTWSRQGSEKTDSSQDLTFSGGRGSNVSHPYSAEAAHLGHGVCGGHAKGGIVPPPPSEFQPHQTTPQQRTLTSPCNSSSSRASNSSNSTASGGSGNSVTTVVEVHRTRIEQRRAEFFSSAASSSASHSPSPETLRRRSQQISPGKSPTNSPDPSRSMTSPRTTAPTQLVGASPSADNHPIESPQNIDHVIQSKYANVQMQEAGVGKIDYIDEPHDSPSNKGRGAIGAEGASGINPDIYYKPAPIELRQGGNKLSTSSGVPDNNNAFRRASTSHMDESEATRRHLEGRLSFREFHSRPATPEMLTAAEAHGIDTKIPGDVLRRAWISSSTQMRSPRFHIILASTLAKSVFTADELARADARGGENGLNEGKRLAIHRAVAKYLGWDRAGSHPISRVELNAKMREIDAAIENLCTDAKRKQTRLQVPVPPR